MIEQVFKGNAKQHAKVVLAGAAFTAEVFFPKIRNLNRLNPCHRLMTMARTEKYDGQNIGAQRRGNSLVFYSRNGVLDLGSLGKGLKTVWENTDFNAKISKIVCTVAKVQHILQKLGDGEFAVRGDGIGKDGRWDGSNAIVPTLIQVVENDCWEESGDLIRELQAEFNVPGRRVNRALEDRVRSAFFDLTLREVLT